MQTPDPLGTMVAWLEISESESDGVPDGIEDSRDTSNASLASQGRIPEGRQDSGAAEASAQWASKASCDAQLANQGSLKPDLLRPSLGWSPQALRGSKARGQCRLAPLGFKLGQVQREGMKRQTWQEVMKMQPWREGLKRQFGSEGMKR